MVGKGGSKVQQRIAIIGLRCYLQSLVHLSRSLKEQGVAIAQETLMSMAILLLYEIIEFVTVTADGCPANTGKIKVFFDQASPRSFVAVASYWMCLFSGVFIVSEQISHLRGHATSPYVVSQIFDDKEESSLAVEDWLYSAAASCRRNRMTFSRLWRGASNNAVQGLHSHATSWIIASLLLRLQKRQELSKIDPLSSPRQQSGRVVIRKRQSIVLTTCHDTGSRADILIRENILRLLAASSAHALLLGDCACTPDLYRSAQ